MSPTRTAIVAGAAAALVITAGLIVGVTSSTADVEARAERPVVVTELPGLPAPTGDSQLPSMDGASPVAGTVAFVDGPFDDRFTTSDLRFDGMTVAGSIRITSDVSELIELEVLAHFYDADGAMIGEGRFVQEGGHEESGHSDSPEEGQGHAFEIAVPADISGQAVSAAVGVPVLVNE